MPDQDFNIKVVTTADTSGIRQTSDALKNLQQQQTDFLKGGPAQTGVEKFIAAQQAAKAAAVAATPDAAVGTGLTGTALGFGTIVYALTRAVRAMQEFNVEQNRIVDGMIKAEEHSRELGLAIADTFEAMKSAERIDTEPLENSFQRLTHDAAVLKTELRQAFEGGDYEGAKRYISQLTVVESQLNRVNMALYRKAEASRKAAEDAEKDAEASAKEAASFLKGAVQTSAPQVQAVLKNEEAARQARAAGAEKDADLYQKTADQLKESMSQASREEYEGLTKPVRLGRQAGPGESQSAIDDISRNQINFNRQLKGEPPLPSGDAGGNQALIDAIHELRDQWQ